MLGAMIGDIAGSVYEFKHELAPKDISLAQMLSNPNAGFTDDSVLTVAVADGIMDYKLNNDSPLYYYIKDSFIRWVEKYPSWSGKNMGYGCMFYKNWVNPGLNREPVNSFGNGTVMRISPVGYLGLDEEDLASMAAEVACVTHTHPAARYGAQMIALAVALAVEGCDKDEMLSIVADRFGIDDIIRQDVKDISDPRQNNINATKAAIQSLIAINGSVTFEEAVLNAIQIGGDTDTIAAITGSVAEALWPDQAAAYRPLVEKKVPAEFLEVIDRFKKDVAGE